ncbi:hypothetical protein FIM04_02980 [SAR202 cluster bacterium AC-409-J13_OGT_754m]|jgi:hypothetical protein|nr:hypothetical protein [SAR202 cluster bacterium AC-409-J13_OGT_754m]
MTKVFGILKWVSAATGTLMALMLLGADNLIQLTAWGAGGSLFLLLAIFFQLEQRSSLVQRIEKPSGRGMPTRQGIVRQSESSPSPSQIEDILRNSDELGDIS